MSSSPFTVWTKLLGTSSSEYGYELTTGSDGSIYIAGYTDGDLDGQTNNGGWDAFISKFHSDGSKIWTRLVGSSGDDIAKAITIDREGYIYIAGMTEGDIDGQTFNTVYRDAFISKFHSLMDQKNGPEF